MRCSNPNKKRGKGRREGKLPSTKHNLNIPTKVVGWYSRYVGGPCMKSAVRTVQ